MLQCQTCLMIVLAFSSHHILTWFFFLRAFACCINLFKFPFILISYPRSYLFGFLRGNTDFILYKFTFALWYFPVGYLLIISFPPRFLTWFFPQSWFPRNRNEIFFSGMIFFNNPTFLFPSVKISFMVLGSKIFRFSVCCVSIQLGWSFFFVLMFRFALRDLVHRRLIHPFLGSQG